MIQIEEVRELDEEWRMATGLPREMNGRTWTVRMDGRPLFVGGVRRPTMVSRQEMWIGPCEELSNNPLRSVRLLRTFLRMLIDEVGPVMSWTECGSGQRLAVLAGMKVVRWTGGYCQLEAQ